MMMRDEKNDANASETTIEFPNPTGPSPGAPRGPSFFGAIGGMVVRDWPWLLLTLLLFGLLLYTWNLASHQEQVCDARYASFVKMCIEKYHVFYADTLPNSLSNTSIFNMPIAAGGNSG